LAKKPTERFAAMQEFAAALERCLPGTVECRGATPGPGARPDPSPTGKAIQPSRQSGSEEAARLHLAARYYLEKRTEEGVRKSINLYYQLLDNDPSFAVAWAGLALAYHALSVRGHASPTIASPKGKSAALRALELDDSLADAHTALAAILTGYDWDFAGAE